MKLFKFSWQAGQIFKPSEGETVAPVHPVNVWALNIFLTKSKTCDELNYFLAIGQVKMKMGV